ncbi:MAG: hypothetical protein RL226_1699 [Bacteroidota bacterium]
MIKVLIIDDEKDARTVLKSLIGSCSNKLEIVGEADSPETGLIAIQELQPDVIFLDVQMRTGTGFDLLKQIEKPNFEVIFITAHNKYALEAFKFSAFGYLLKPVKTRDLKEVIERLENHLAESKSTSSQRLNVLIENYGSDGAVTKLIIANSNGFQVLKISQIIRLEGDGNYTHFILEGGKKMTSSKNLGEYEELLNDYGFFRIHQSTIISLRHVTGFQKADGGRVELTDGSDHRVSRYRKNDFLKRFE